jgi:wyosine [tRNA(Phe)-imidazoG37] synthetase (radical SAM superfamily)
MAFKMNYKSSSLCKNLEGMDEKLRVVLLMYLSTKALGLESYMKLNRPWTDRTGMAKMTLRATMSQPSEEVFRITLSHGVDYGIWLELANEKNFAIIGPTIDQKGPEIQKGLNNLMAKLV